MATKARGGASSLASAARDVDRAIARAKRNGTGSKRSPAKTRTTSRRRARRDDDLSNRGPIDRAHVNRAEPWEVRHVAEKFGVSEAAVERAIDAVGTSRKKVESYLGRSRRDPAKRPAKRGRTAKRRAPAKRGRKKPRTAAQRAATARMLAANKARKAGGRKASRRDWPGNEAGHRKAAKKGWRKVARTGVLKGRKARDPAPKKRAGTGYDHAPRRRKGASSRGRRPTKSRRGSSYRDVMKSLDRGSRAGY